VLLLSAFLRRTPPEIVAEPTLDEVRAAERCINAKDAPILAAALKGGASCIVSGNTRHFTPDVAECAGIAIFAPAAYLATLAP
jgi:predicted nucleic acid-binding protein